MEERRKSVVDRTRKIGRGRGEGLTGRENGERMTKGRKEGRGG